MGFKDSIYWRIYGDVWNFHKEYVGVRKDDEHWDDVTEAAEEIRRKYKGRPEGEFVIQLLLSVIEELERVSKMK